MGFRYTKVLTALIITMFVLVLTGCGTKLKPESAAAQGTTSGQTVQKEIQAVPLKMYVRERWAGVSYDNFSTHYIEDKTKTKWDLTIVPGNVLEVKLNILLSSGEKFDIIQYSTDEMEMKLQKSGKLYPINKSFDQTPNLVKWADENVWNAMTYPDGNIYSIPATRGKPENDFIPMYRKDWLDKLGLVIPETVDEYYDAALAVSTQDPDGNGKKDTYAFGSYGVSDLRNFDHIFGAFGVLPPAWIEVDGHLMNSTIAPGAKEALKYLNKLYKAGVIDPEFVTDNEDRYKTKFMNGIYGAMCYKIYLFDSNNRFDYYKPFHENNPTAILIDGPILKGGSENPLGMRIMTQRSWLKTGISADSENIDAALRVIDWITSEEGTMFVNYGVERKDYKVENGVVNVIIDDEQMKQRGITQCYLAMKSLINHTSAGFQKMCDNLETISTPDLGDGILVDEIKNMEELIIYMRGEYAKMIVGDLSIDEGFDQFVNEWNIRGGEALTKAMDAVYQQRK